MDSWFISFVQQYIPEVQMSVPFIGDVNATPFMVAVVVFLLLSLLFKLLQIVVLHNLRSISARTSTDVDDVVIAAVSGIRAWVYTIVALYVSLQLFTLPHTLDVALSGLVYLVVAWQVIEVITCFVNYGVKRFVERDEDGDGVVDPGAATASDMITLMARIILWTMGLLFVLSNLGIEITSLIAGLGIGGIAIAFALQGILSDLFASFSIYFDRPFRVGDYIVLGTDSGTVERIGIKSTRIRTLQGEELVVSNAELTTARVNNFKKMQERRINFQFGVTYETSYEKVKQINGMVERIFGAVEGARLDRVHFTTFGDSALLFDVVYYVESAEYAEYLDLQQRVNFELMDKFAEVGIEFAYPTQTIYHKQVS